MMHSRFALAYAEMILAGGLRLFAPHRIMKREPFVSCCPDFNGPLTIKED